MIGRSKVAALRPPQLWFWPLVAFLLYIIRPNRLLKIIVAVPKPRASTPVGQFACWPPQHRHNDRNRIPAITGYANFRRNSRREADRSSVDIWQRLIGQHNKRSHSQKAPQSKRRRFYLKDSNPSLSFFSYFQKSNYWRTFVTFLLQQKLRLRPGISLSYFQSSSLLSVKDHSVEQCLSDQFCWDFCVTSHNAVVPAFKH